MTLRVCLKPGCPVLTEDSRCVTHRKAKRRREDRRRPSAKARGYDQAWAKTRKSYLAAFPNCEKPGCPELASNVDHVDGLGPNGPQGHDWANLRSFCHSHHSQRTARDQPGGFNA